MLQIWEVKSLCLEAAVDAAGAIGVLTTGVVVVAAMIAVVNGRRMFDRDITRSVIFRNVFF
jgi:hypothetical protein